MHLTISDLGEKSIIETIIKPMFNPENDDFGIGDDCAFILNNNEDVVLLSTDRVPADLIAFKLGLIDLYGLGRYLSLLNLSDIAACGGSPIGLLLNFGLPSTLLISELEQILYGIKSIIDKYNCKVLGGDLTSSTEISLSATSIGKVNRNKILKRKGAQVGDYVFISRPIGYTPAAFEYFLNLKPKGISLPTTDEFTLIKQFTDMTPLFELSHLLSNSGDCSSCMDNTDGLGQTLSEIASINNVKIELQTNKINIDELPKKIGHISKKEILPFIFSSGADFSLVGTLRSNKTEEEYLNKYNDIHIIGQIKAGKGIYVKKNTSIDELTFKSWNYFADLEL